MGVPTNVASATIIREPQMALAMPPSSLGGGVICENSAKLRPPTPWRTVSHRIQTSQKTPNSMAAKDRASASRFIRLRLSYLAWRTAARSAALSIFVEVELMSGLLHSSAGG